MDTRLNDKVVVITGASQGMGRAAAQAFAAEGAKLALCARNAKNLQRTAEDCFAISEKKVMAKPVDVTDISNLRKFIQGAADKFGRIDVLICNAGGPPAKTFMDIKMEDWQNTFALNFLSVAMAAREVIPIMKTNKWGRILTITSTSVRQPIPDLALSSVIRPAVVGLVKTLANEVGKDGITVNNIAPGYTETDRLKEVLQQRAIQTGMKDDELRKKWSLEIPMRRLGQPNDIADTLVWLASEQAGYITGQTIFVDGGNYRGM